MVVVLGAAALATGGPTSSGGSAGAAASEIPPSLLPVYQHAAATCSGLPWQVLAAIGYHESRHAAGHADPSTGDVRPPIVGPPLDGRAGRAQIPDPSEPDGWMHALGPMQFLPTTWRTWARLRAPADRPARDHRSRTRGTRSSPPPPTSAAVAPRSVTCAPAIDGYAGSTDYYPRLIAKALDYGLNVASRPGGGGAAAVAVAIRRELGVPYVYGAASPTAGFDCSGLVVWAYAQVGVHLPWVTYDQVRGRHPGQQRHRARARRSDLQPR